ncbi:MAG TPA: DUF2306 domain-containing protein [Candidatus Sulfotelmatobacter sp.]|nr:DUF2306 domain-containing protein [Candidatus Sulfotelmatobacter sp.]
MPAATSPTVKSRSPAKILFFLGFFALTILAAYVKNAGILDPASPIARHYAPATWFLPVHAVFGILAMGLAAFQFSNRLRARYLWMHRFLGYAYVTSVFISAPFAVVVAFKIPKPSSVIAANCMQALGWVVCTAIALYCVRTGNIALHRRWMIRSYPFAMVFTAGRAVAMFFPAILLNPSAGEAVFWIAIVLAALLPSIFLDWPAMHRRSVERAGTATRSTTSLAP